MTDALYNGLLQASRRGANDIGKGHGIAAMVRLCIKHHLPKLKQPAADLELTDEEFAESQARIARGTDM